MLPASLSLVLITEPVLATLIRVGFGTEEVIARRKLAIAVIGTDKGYFLAGIDAEKESIVCTSSMDFARRLTPLEAIQAIRELDGLQVFTLSGAYSDEVEEFNQLIDALRGDLNGHRLAALAQKFGEIHPESWRSTMCSMPSNIEMEELLSHFSRDRGLSYYMSAHHTVVPYMKQQELIGWEELYWLKGLTLFLLS